MALIKCPECGREVSDSASQCPNCGFGVSKFVHRQKRIVEIQQETEREAYLYVKRKKKEEKEKAEQDKKAEIARKNEIYNHAVNMFDSMYSEDVEEAQELFSSLLGWKDSDVYYENCRGRIEELRRKEEAEREKRKKRNKKIALIEVVISCLAIVISLVYVNVIVPKRNLAKGIEAIKEETFEEVGLYLSQEEQLVVEVQTAYFDKACDCIENKKLDSFVVCSNKIKDESLYEKLYDLCHSYAQQYYSDGDYYSAYIISCEFDFEYNQILPDKRYITKLMNDRYSMHDLQILMESGMYDSLPEQYKVRVDEMLKDFEMIQGSYKGGLGYYYVDGLDIYEITEYGTVRESGSLKYDFTINKWVQPPIIGDKEYYLEVIDENTFSIVNKCWRVDNLPDEYVDYFKQSGYYEEK